MSRAPRSVLFVSLFVSLLFWSHLNSFLLADEKSDLNQILENCAQYCEQLSNSALYFVCTEKVEETIRKPQESASHTFHSSGGTTYTVYGGVQTERYTYIYDYQLIRKEGVIKESRILLKEDGKKKHEENAPLKTERFYYKHVIFGPTGLLSRKAQLKHDFKIIKHGKFNKEQVVVIRATPKNEKEVSHLYGDIWVSKNDFRILKIEWNQQSLQDYEKMEEIAEQSNAVPQTVLVSEYGYEHNGIQFPSKYTIKEIYESKIAALHFLDTQLKPTDEVAVLSFNHVNFLVLHQYLTTDHKKVREVIKEVKLLTKVPEGVPLNPSREVQMPSGKEHLSSPLFTEKQAKANICTKQLKDLAKSFSSIPGYKSLIYFSQGFDRGLLFAPDQTLREKYQDTGKELGSSSTAVYSVNTGGGGKGEESLKMISNLSGGKYFENVEYYQEIARNIHETTGNYYVLAYYIDDKWDGTFHEINVKVKRKDCAVQSQSGYFNPKPFSELSEFEKKLHLIDLAMNENPYHQIPVEIPSLALTLPGDKQSILVLLSRLPLDTLGEIILSQIELAAFVFDEQKNIIDSRMGELSLHDIDKENIFHYILSSVPDGNYENCIVIRNLKTGKAAVARTFTDVSSPPEAGLFLYPPLLLEPEKEAFYIHTLKKQKDEKTEQPLSIKDVYPFLTSSVSPVIDRIEKGTSKLLAVVVNSIRGIENPDIHLTAEVINQSTKEKILLDSQIISVENKGTADILLLELELPELDSGEYCVEFTVLEKKTGKTSRQKTGAFLIF